MSEHTKEPWHVGDGKQANIVYAQDGWAVANATVFHARHASHDDAIAHQNANASRIVACVNACEGIQTDDLARLMAENERLREALEDTVTRINRASRLASATLKGEPK